MGGGGSRRSGEDKEKKRCGKVGESRERRGEKKKKKMGKSRGKMRKSTSLD